MNTLLLAVIVIVVVVVFLALAKGKGGAQAYPYQQTRFLLSKAERSFYGVLVQAVGDSGIVFSKVRVADVISPRKGLNRSDWQRAFNAVSSKHFDFIVCEPTDCSVKLAVELDDSSHGSSKAQKRDSFLNGACQSAGVPLLRIKAAKSYTVADLKRQLEESISPQLAEPEPLSPQAAVETAAVKLSEERAATSESVDSYRSSEEGAALAEPREAKLEPHTCPKCGEPMILRKAKSGANAGQEFWGCSAFPRCRAVVPTGA